MHNLGNLRATGAGYIDGSLSLGRPLRNPFLLKDESWDSGELD